MCHTLLHTATHCRHLFVVIYIWLFIEYAVPHAVSHYCTLSHIASHCRTTPHIAEHHQRRSLVINLRLFIIFYNAARCRTQQRIAALCCTLAHGAARCRNIFIVVIHDYLLISLSCTLLRVAAHNHTQPHTAVYCRTLPYSVYCYS